MRTSSRISSPDSTANTAGPAITTSMPGNRISSKVFRNMVTASIWFFIFRIFAPISARISVRLSSFENHTPCFSIGFLCRLILPCHSSSNPSTSPVGSLRKYRFSMGADVEARPSSRLSSAVDKPSTEN